MTFNAATHFVDRHLAEGRGGRTAFRFRGAPGDVYADVAAMTARCGHALTAVGVEIENRVVIALPDQFKSRARSGLSESSLDTLPL